MSRNIIIALTATILLTLIIISLVKTNTLKSLTENKVRNSLIPSAEQNQKDSPPIPTNHPNYINTYSTYALAGQVEDLNEAEETLILTSKGDPIPRFKLTKDTQVNRVIDQSKTESASLSDVKTGMNVTISVMFDSKISAWVVYNITILQTTQLNQNSTTSSTPINN